MLAQRPPAGWTETRLTYNNFSMNRASPPVTGITADFASEHSIEPRLQHSALALAFCIEETAIELSICSYDT